MRYARIYQSANDMSCAEAETKFGVRFEPCPFCHNPYPVVWIHNHGTYVRCLNCGAEGPQVTMHMHQGFPHNIIVAVNLWNLRTPPEQPSLRSEPHRDHRTPK